jgi:hypothetical protein
MELKTLVITLIDPNENQFEVLVEKINGNIYLTHGWFALHDFYNIQQGRRHVHSPGGTSLH